MLSSAGQTARPIWLKIFLGKPMATPESDYTKKKFGNV